MRTFLAAATTLGLATLGAIVPATGAHASAACDTAWHNAKSGYFYAYDYDNCSGVLGADVDNDSNWADSSGAFQGSDNDAVQSVVHKGTSGMHVKLFRHAGYGGGHTCIKKSEYYMSDLSGFTFTDGSPVNVNVSSHQWVSSGCGKFLDS